MITTNFKICIFILLISTLTACGGGVPRKPVNELPSHIEVVSVNFETAAWKLRITHRHKENRLNSQIKCDLLTNQDTTLALNWTKLPELSYQLTETITIPGMPTNATTVDLPKKVNYQLNCELISENFQAESITKKAVLHKVPGEKSVYR